MSPGEIQYHLSQFTGDLERIRHPLNRRLIYTPGVDYMAESCGAYWLIDIVASVTGTELHRRAAAKDDRLDSIVFWNLDVRDHEGIVTARADSGVKPWYVQEIPWTDFPLREIDLWCAFDGQWYTLYLPSEH